MRHSLMRLVRHRFYDESDVRRALPASAMARIEARVAGSEHGHSGEIRVCVEASLPLRWLWRGLSARDRAVSLFGELRVWDTENNNGVLIYLLLAERAIEIVADRGINRQVTPDQWQALIDPMRQAFRDARFEEGLGQAIAAIDGLLRRNFAINPSDNNADELPNRPDIR